MNILTHVVLVFAVVVISQQAAEAVQDIDQFTVKNQANWSCAKTIAVRLFPYVGKFEGKKELAYYQKYFADELASGLRKIKGIEKVDVIDNDAPVSADILIDGRFAELTSGSRALRFWVGFGAGRSSCRAKIKGIEPKTEEVVFRLDHARNSGMGISSDDEVIENIDEVVEDVTAGLKTVRGVCTPAMGSVQTERADQAGLREE